MRQNRASPVGTKNVLILNFNIRQEIAAVQIMDPPVPEHEVPAGINLVRFDAIFKVAYKAVYSAQRVSGGMEALDCLVYKIIIKDDVRIKRNVEIVSIAQDDFIMRGPESDIIGTLNAGDYGELFFY